MFNYKITKSQYKWDHVVKSRGIYATYLKKRKNHLNLIKTLLSYSFLSTISIFNCQISINMRSNTEIMEKFEKNL